MNKFVRVIICSFMVCGLLVASDYGFCEVFCEKNSLAFYVEKFPNLLALAYYKICSGDNTYIDWRIGIFPAMRSTQEGAASKEIQSTFTISLYELGFNGNVISFYKRHESLFAAGVKLFRIGRPMPTDIATCLQKINLDNNFLNSFQDIQENILDVCPSLVSFSARYNKFVGSFSISHKRLYACDVSHNKFTSIGHIRLPGSPHLNLSFNNIEKVESTDPDTEYIVSYIANIDGNPIDTKPTWHDYGWQNELLGRSSEVIQSMGNDYEPFLMSDDILPEENLEHLVNVTSSNNANW